MAERSARAEPRPRRRAPRPPNFLRMADILAGASAEPSSKRRRVLTGAVGGLPPEVASALREDVLHWAAAGGLMIGAALSLIHI